MCTLSYLFLWFAVASAAAAVVLYFRYKAARRDALVQTALLQTARAHNATLNQEVRELHHFRRTMDKLARHRSTMDTDRVYIQDMPGDGSVFRANSNSKPASPPADPSMPVDGS
jgi:cell division protein FtsB